MATLDKRVIYCDTDSVAGSSIIRVNGVAISIREFFDFLSHTEEQMVLDLDGRVFIIPKNTKIPMLDIDTMSVKSGKIKYLEQHIVKKRMFRVVLTNGKFVDVSEDHSIMVLTEDTKLITKKPIELSKEDKIISIQ